MKVKELIRILNKLEPELEIYTFYDHGVVHRLNKNQIVLVDEESKDKFTPRGVVFCAHHDDEMELMIKNRNYKSVKHLD